MTSTLDPTHPLARLPRMTRREVALVDTVAGWLPPDGTLSFADLEASLGRPARARVGAPRPFRSEGSVATRCSERILVEHVPSGLRGVVELDAPLAVTLAWLALDRAVDPSMPAPRALDRAEQGVLLYLVARAIWGGGGPAAPLRVAGVLAEDGAIEEACDAAVTVPLSVELGDLGGHGWVHLPAGVARLGSAPFGGRPGAATLEGLDGVRFGLHVLVGRAVVSVSEWASARPGDALILDEAWARPSPEGLRGEVRLRLGGGAPRWSATLDGGGRLTVERSMSTEGGTMVEDRDAGSEATARELLSELPLALTVELGSVALTAQQALELRPGQTLLLGRRPGDPVELRAGEKLLARGELVDVEGELGVRLAEICTGAGGVLTSRG